MQGSEVQENNNNKMCRDCLHYIGFGDRCDETHAVCYYGSFGYDRYEDKEGKENDADI